MSKIQNLPLFFIINLDQLREEQNLESTLLTDFIVAWNQNVYLLMEQQVADTTAGEAQNTNKDWLNSPSVIHRGGNQGRLDNSNSFGYGKISSRSSKVSVSLYSTNWQQLFALRRSLCQS